MSENISARRALDASVYLLPFHLSVNEILSCIIVINYCILVDLRSFYILIMNF